MNRKEYRDYEKSMRALIPEPTQLTRAKSSRSVNLFIDKWFEHNVYIDTCIKGLNASLSIYKVFHVGS